MPQPPSFRPYRFAFLFLSLAGWAGLYALLTYSPPYLWARWGFFVLLVSAVTGSALPLVFGANRLFSAANPPGARVILRQSLWFGIYAAVLAWLSIGRLLTFGAGLWLALGIAAIEYFLRVRETSPQAAQDEPA